MNYTIKNNALTVTISSHGAELISAVGNDGFEYIWQGDEEYWNGHAPILFPACGQTLNKRYKYKGAEYEMLPHGFAMRNEFSLVSKSDASVILMLSANETTKRNYPFDFSLVAEYKIENNHLFANFTVQNTGNSAMPYMFGWHPGFVLEAYNGSSINDFTVKFEGKESVIWHPLQHGCFVSPIGTKYPIKNSEYKLCEDEIYKNDTLIFVDSGYSAYLSSPKEKHAVNLSYSKNLPYFCIWKADSPDARFICLEPWSDVPGDGESEENFETKKMSRLSERESAVYSYRVDFLTL